MIQLSPDKFADSVRFFNNFFKLKINRPNLSSLQQILEKFAVIPYENISKIIKLSTNWESEVKLRLPDEVMEDHARFHLGGTCFSLTFLLETILRYHGYQCYPVMANMKAGPNIHCAIIVILDNQKYLIDPGYLLTSPMKLNLSQRLYRAASIGVELRFNLLLNCYQLFTFTQQKTTWRYNFKDIPCPQDKFLRHWQASFTKPSMHGICLTKIETDGLIYIHKKFMRRTSHSSKINFNIKNNYHQTIHDIFGIPQELIEKAGYALQFNLEMERKLKIWVPRGK
ncbi:MAG: arylamine N-acetyltransferase [bacterium]|nr:arylamine N-acetyltransferase [bacterium]